MTPWLPVALAAAAAAMCTTRTTPGALRLASLDRGGRRAESSPGLPAVAAPAVWLLPASVVVVSGPVAGALVAVAVVVIGRARTTRRSAREHERERGRALDALALLAADLRVGRSPADALSTAADVACGPTGRALAAAAAAARLGGDVPAALDVGGSAVPRVLRGLGACWLVCHEAGTGLAAAVERLEDGLRAAEAQRRAMAAELAGPQATAQLLAGLPVVGVGLAAALGARPLGFLFHTGVGVVCLVLGLLLDAGGVLWTRRLTRRAVPLS